MNRLAGATSPYLEQHAHNPVDWQPWDQAALDRARAEDKPIFLSIGYAACHWCHVMAHESFEDPETAALMNAHFVNIKVDREERPDLDGIYMQAAVAMTGSGGWPLSVFLKPDLQPFYAGTYFPPTPRFNLPSFKELLKAIAKAWNEDRAKIELAAAQAVEHLRRQPAKRAGQAGWNASDIHRAAEGLLQTYDWVHGGWGPAPRFPSAMVLDFLLAHAVTQKPRREDLVRLVKHCLDSMSRGGFHDVVGGGFARYSTDVNWHIPHFEKMLYDNALLGRVYLHAWQVTGDASLRDVTMGISGFLIRDLGNAEGGFCSSLDADSPGGEGAYYAWTVPELRRVLSEHSEFFEAAYGVTSRGNWEGKEILHRALDDATLAAKFGVDRASVRERLAECRARLLAFRERRLPPAADDKVLAAWNGLALAFLAEYSRSLAGEAVAKTHYQTATRTAQFLLTSLRPDGQLRRAWRDGRCSSEVFLDDYAGLILGLLELYQTDFQVEWFRAATQLADEMIARFRDPDGTFYDTPTDGQVVLLRPRDLQDNATPSGASLASEVLLKLAALTGSEEYASFGHELLEAVAGMANEYPLGFGRWLAVADFGLAPPMQVALVGQPGDEGYQALLDAVRGDFRPHLVIAASPYPPEPGSPQLLDKRPTAGGNATAFVCHDFVCDLPTTEPTTLLAQLRA